MGGQCHMGRRGVYWCRRENFRVLSSLKMTTATYWWFYSSSARTEETSNKACWKYVQGTCGLRMYICTYAPVLAASLILHWYRTDNWCACAQDSSLHAFILYSLETPLSSFQTRASTPSVPRLAQEKYADGSWRSITKISSILHAPPPPLGKMIIN